MTPPAHPDDAAFDASFASLSASFLVGGGRFTLVRMLGRGRMGLVWLARDEHLHEDVALKFLPPEIRHDAIALDDLRRETSHSRRLTHPHIIRIHDFYKSEHEAFISMEFVNGPNLADLHVAQPERVFKWDYLVPAGHTTNVLAVAMSPGGRFLASADAAGVIIIWNAASGTRLHLIPSQAGLIRCLAFRDDTLLASGGTEPAVRMWDVSTGKLAKKISALTAEVTALTFSPDGTVLATGARDGSRRHWEATKFRVRLGLPRGQGSHSHTGVFA